MRKDDQAANEVRAETLEEESAERRLASYPFALAAGVIGWVHNARDMSDADRRRLSHLRFSVWSHLASTMAGAPGEEGLWWEELDARSYHLTIGRDAHSDDQSRLVAGARLSIFQDARLLPGFRYLPGQTAPGPVAYLGRLVVAEESRGQGYARYLDQLRCQIAWSRGCQEIYGIAVGWQRAQSLARHGFRLLRRLPADSGFLSPEFELFLVRLRP